MMNATDYYYLTKMIHGTSVPSKPWFVMQVCSIWFVCPHLGSHNALFPIHIHMLLFQMTFFLQRETNSLLITQEGNMSEANGVRSRSLSLEIPLIEEAEVPLPLSSPEENNYRYNK